MKASQVLRTAYYRYHTQGYTLIELMVTVAVVGLLAIAAIGAISGLLR